MSTTSINIVSAEQTGGYRIRLVFADHKTQEVDFRPFLMNSHHPDIRAYLDPVRFAAFRIEHGDLVWGDYGLCFPVFDLYCNRIEHKDNIAAAA